MLVFVLVLVQFSQQFFSHCYYDFRDQLLLYCVCIDYTQTIPDAILCPNKDARARSVRLQLGTAHIQRSTETRQVSVVMGRTRFWLLSALSMLRAQQPPTRLVWLRLGTDPPDGSELTWPRPYICLFTLIVLFREEFLLHSSGHPFYWGVSLTLLELVLVRSFSYNPRAGLVRSFFYTPDTSLSAEFPLHSWC